MSASRAVVAQSPADIDAQTIETRIRCGTAGAELLLRSRPPGVVRLASGHRDHLLMCTVGETLPGCACHSVLQTEGAIREWNRPPTGQVSFLPAGMPFEWEWTYRSSSIHLVLPKLLIEEIREQLADDHPPQAPLRPIFRVGHEPLRQTLVQLREEALARASGHRLVLSSLAIQAAVQLLRFMTPVAPEQHASSTTGPTLSPRQLRRTFELLEERIDENVSLGELARECGLSTFHFARAFKNSVGHPPHEYQLRLRVQRAQELLLSSPRRGVAGIAVELGFADESHLRRHFKRIVGTTPGRFRK